MFGFRKPSEKISIEISPDNWALVEPLIKAALELDKRVDDLEVKAAMMKLQAMAIHTELWAAIKAMYPQLAEHPCHIDKDARRIESFDFQMPGQFGTGVPWAASRN